MSEDLAIPQFTITGPSRSPSPLQGLEATLLDPIDFVSGDCGPSTTFDTESDIPTPRVTNGDHGQQWSMAGALPSSTAGVECSLEIQLLNALCPHAHKESKPFLPRDKLQQLVVEDSVREELSACFPDQPADRILEYARMICAKTEAPSTSRPSYIRVFAVLVMVQKPNEILTFLLNSITDHDLPLAKCRSQHGSSVLYGLRRRSESDKPLECLQQWSPFLVNAFHEYQWTVLSPCFSKNSGDGVRHYRLEDNSILPFIEDSSRIHLSREDPPISSQFPRHTREWNFGSWPSCFFGPS